MAGVLHNQPEIGSGRSRNRNHDRRGTVETDSQRFGRTAVDLEIGYRAIAVTLFYLQRAGGFKGLNRRTYDQGAGGKRFRRGQVDRQRPGRRKYDRGSRIAIGQVSYPGHLRLRHDSGGHLYPGVFRRRIGDHLDILKQFVRLGQLRYQPLGSRNVGFGRSQVTHRLFGFDPRAARLAPAGRIENTDIDTQFPGGLQRRVQDIPPLVGKDFNRPVGNTAILDIADERTVDSRFFHRLQVLYHSFLAEVVRHPVPIDAGLDRVGRRHEPCLEGLARQRLFGRAAGEKCGPREQAKRRAQ